MDSNNKIAVNNITQLNKGIISRLNNFIFKIVEIKLIDPIIEDIPATCKEKIDQSTEGPLCDKFPNKGG